MTGAHREIAPGLFHVSGIGLDEIPANAMVAIARTRDEAWRLPFWLAYYRWIGIDRFIVIDNRSTDATAENLSREPDVTVLAAPGPYEQRHKWTRPVLLAAPPERWNLLLDMDEFFVPSPWRKDGLRDVVRDIEGEDADVAHAVMVDCYPDAFPVNGRGASAVPWLRAPWFDAGPYAKWNRLKRRPHLVYNGARQRIFWPRWSWQRHLPGIVGRTIGIEKPPFISKAPLFRNAAAQGTSDHRTAMPAARRSRRVFHMLHYKFDVDFVPKVSTAIAEQQHFSNSAEYKIYGRLLGGGTVSLTCDRSRRFDGLKSLVEAKIFRSGRPDPLRDAAALDAGTERAWAEIRTFGGAGFGDTVTVPGAGTA